MTNIHENCDNYNPKKDYCLKFFKKNISSLKECQEKTVFNDKELSRKWSNWFVVTANALHHSDIGQTTAYAENTISTHN